MGGIATVAAAIGAEMDRIAAEREASQPLRSRTGRAIWIQGATKSRAPSGARSSISAPMLRS